jgi:hypothetical protein
VLSIAFREVEPGEERPDAGGPLPWDWVVFTPGTERGDPCEGLRPPPAGSLARGGAGPG